MVWLRKPSMAVAVAALLVCGYAVQTPVSAAVSKAALLNEETADSSMLKGWILQIDDMRALGNNRTVVYGDAAWALGKLSELHANTVADISDAALASDARRFNTLHASLASFEGPKVSLESTANQLWATVYLGEDSYRLLELAGGHNPSSPVHRQTDALGGAISYAEYQLNRADSLLDRATLAGYPRTAAMLPVARQALGLATGAVATINGITRLPLPGGTLERGLLRESVCAQFQMLTKLKAEVLADRNLTPAERANLIAEINADILESGLLCSFLATGAGGLKAEELWLIEQPGVFLPIRPKVEIMLAAAADRTALGKLSVEAGVLQFDIQRASLKGKDMTVAGALLADYRSQLAVAGADIAPIDSEFESMKAITPTQQNQDAIVARAALASVQDANTRLTLAVHEAAQILSLTA